MEQMRVLSYDRSGRCNLITSRSSIDSYLRATDGRLDARQTGTLVISKAEIERCRLLERRD